MKKKSLFQASFEESLNLMDDSISGEFCRKNLSSAQVNEKYRGTLKSYVWVTICSILFLIGPNWLFVVLADYSFCHPVQSSPVLPPVYNFLPSWVFILFLSLWLLIIVLGKFLYQRFILIYRGQFHIFITFFIWLMIEGNLLVLTWFYSTLKWTGAMLYFLLHILMVYAIVQSRYSSLRTLLYGEKEHKAEGRYYKLFSKLAGFLVTYGLGVVGLYLVLQFLFPQIFVIRLDVIGVLIMWFFINIGIVLLEVYLIFPFMLQGYYKWKYPEEYREWESQSVEEWYGKAYLKKHPELLELEGKDKHVF